MSPARRRRRYAADNRSAGQTLQDAAHSPNISRYFDGWVADWCYICRAFSFHHQFRYVRSVLGTGDAFLIENVCYECGCTLPANREEHLEPLPEAGSSFQELAARTSPELIVAFEERVQLEARVKRHEITDHERDKLIRESIGVIHDAGSHEENLARLNQRGDAKLTAVRYFIMIITVWCAAFLFRPYVLHLFLLGVLLLFIGFGRYIYMRSTHMKRYYRRELQPLLERALAPLQPSQTELMDASRAQKRFKLAEVMDLRGVCDRVAVNRD